MSTMTGKLRRMIVSGAVTTMIAGWAVGAVQADVTSDQAAAILIFPKIVVDTSGVLGPPTDTEIQVTNASNSVIAARCNLVNATSFCSNSPINDPIACTPETEASANPRCGTAGVCVPQWTENDFRMTLTKRQPVSWKASEGRLTDFPLSSGSSVPNAQTDPFIGELKCVEVDPSTFRPISGFDPLNNGGGDLKGEATIVSAESGTGKVDARKYSAIGLQATDLNNGDDVLNIGGPEAEYSGCPNVLVLNHFFDDASITTTGGTTGTVKTELTVIPCGEDFSTQIPTTVTLQFLVFNEFEQRFSTSTRVTCLREVQLSNIDTRPTEADNIASIFNVNVQGTFAGQTRIRSVTNGDIANTVLAVAEEFWDCDSGPTPKDATRGRCSAAANVHFQGSRELGDTITLASDAVPEP